MKVEKKQWVTVPVLFLVVSILALTSESRGATYGVPNTEQSLCFDSIRVVSPPSSEEPFYGQDAQYQARPTLAH